MKKRDYGPLTLPSAMPFQSEPGSFLTPARRKPTVRVVLMGSSERGTEPFRALTTHPEFGDRTVTSSETPYHFEKYDGVSVIALLPELNDVAWADIESIGSALLKQMEAQKKSSFLIDLDALTYMGSAMVALVIRLWKSVKERQGKMAVINSHEMVREVLSIAGLDEVWTIVDTRAEGFKALGVSARKIRSQGMIPDKSPKENSTSQDAGMGMALFTLLSLVVAAAGLFLLVFPQDFIPDQRIVLGLLFGGSLLGLLIGTAATTVGSGMRRGIGIFGVVSSVGILAAGVFNMPTLKTVLENNPNKTDSKAVDEKPVVGDTVKLNPTGKNEQSKTPDAKGEISKIVILKTAPVITSQQTIPTITSTTNDEIERTTKESQENTGQKRELEIKQP